MSYLVLWIGNSLQLEKRTFWSWPTLMMENPTLPIVSSTGTTYQSAISSIYCVCFLVFHYLFYLGLHHGARHFSRVVLTPSPHSPPSAPIEEPSGFQCLDGRRVHVKCVVGLPRALVLMTKTPSISFYCSCVSGGRAMRDLFQSTVFQHLAAKTGKNSGLKKVSS